MNEKKLNIIETNRTGICFIGDIHGEFNALQGLMKQTDFIDTSYIICGDCGFGFEKEQYYSNVFNRLNRKAAQLDCEFLMIRGNHDCLSSNTRVVTKRGIITYDKLTLEDSVLSFNTKNSTCEWHKIDDIIVRDSQEIFVQNGRSLRIECTNNHRHLLKDGNEYVYKKTIELNSVKKSYRYDIIHGAKIEQPDYNIKDDEIRITAWIMTDGYYGDKKHRYYNISQSKEKYIDEIKEILDRLKADYYFNFRKRNGKKIIIEGKTVKSYKDEGIFRLHSDFSKYLRTHFLEDKHKLPKWVYDLSYRQLKIFTDTLLQANGTILKHKGNYMLFGTYEALLSFQPLFSMCGYRCSLVKDKRGDYRLNICENNHSHILVNGRKFTKEEYNGKVFCLTTKLSNFLAENNGKIYFTGNCPQYFDGKKINRKYFKAIPDYTVIQTPIYNILCIGGATSIDRQYRLEVTKQTALKYAKYHNCSISEAEKLCRQCYWEDESPKYNEEALNELKARDIKVDIVATHTCPSFCKPLTKDGIQYWLQNDPTLEKTVNDERKVMDKVYNKLISDGHPLQKWFYGHYHWHNQEYIDGVQYITLDMYRYGHFDIYDLLTTKKEI